MPFFSLHRIKGHLGSGQFGSVEQGLWRDGANSVLVALKLLKEGSTKIDKTKFLQEAAIMAQFRHPNVVKLYGVVSKSEPVSLPKSVSITYLAKINYEHSCIHAVLNLIFLRLCTPGFPCFMKSSMVY